MEREGSLQGLEAFDQLSLERGRSKDVDELDNEGWQIANQEQRIVQMRSLGEGAGGAVTKCMLKGGKTLFALKVGLLSVPTSLSRSHILFRSSLSIF